MALSHLKQQQLRGDFIYMQENNLKPNFTALSRKHNIDRHTVAKYYKSNGKQPVKKYRKSKFDPFLKEIRCKTESCPTTTKKAMFEYFRRKYPAVFTSYSSFKYYVTKHQLMGQKKELPKLRYENDPGEYMQVDWKEEMKMTLKNGKKITFNVYGATLSYSRYHLFIYSNGKGQKDFMRCTTMALKELGGKPKKILTDNMAAICNHSTRKLLPGVIEFGKDMDIDIKRCKIKHPYTKGKVESANRFLEWLKPYDGELESVEELVNVLKDIQVRANEEVNRTTGVPPVILLKKELKYLTALPNDNLMNQFIEKSFKQVVPQTLLIRYNGAEYSVPSEFMGKTISFREINHELYIYHNTKLIAVHNINKKNSINYATNHYHDVLFQHLNKKYNDDEIRQISMKNIESLAQIGDYDEY